MTATLMPNGKLRFYDSAGRVLVGGKLYTYSAGTLVPKATFFDQAGTVPNTNPIILDVRGEALVRWDGAYKYVLTDANDVVIETIDDYTSANIAFLGSIGANLIGFLYAAVYQAGSIGRWLQDLALSTGAGFIGWIQLGAGAITRSIMAKLRERVSVLDFGADPTGVADSTAAILAALASFTGPGTLYFPRGFYVVSASLTIEASKAGIRLEGDSANGAYLLTPNGTTFDMLKVAGSYSLIKGLLFRPGGDQVCIRTYSAHTHIKENRFLADVNNVGTAILTADIDPDTAAFVPGAYTHTIEDNVIGVAGFAFARGIDASSTAGMQALKIRGNQILSNAPISIPRGGGNTISENLLQSSAVGVGVGIDLGANEAGDMVYGNYLEGFADAVLTRQVSNANPIVRAAGNHYDGNTNKFNSFGGAVNYVFENDGGSMWTNGWLNNYSSVLINRWLTPSGTEGFALTSAGYFLVNTVTGTNHTLNTPGVAEGGVIFTIQGSGNSASFMRYVLGAAANGANCGYSVRANSVNSRSINAGGTINASGADYAEYMRKSRCCFDIIKGQIIGTDINGELTDKLDEAISFFVKSTNPSLVGGDTWGNEQPPEEPVLPEVPKKPTPPRRPRNLETPSVFIDEKHRIGHEAEVAKREVEMKIYDVDMHIFARACTEYDEAMVKHASDCAASMEVHEEAMRVWSEAHEVERAKVDRIAFCGQVPVNVYGAKPGDLILPDGGGTVWDMLNDPEVPNWAKKMHRSVGKVIAIEPDGRARIVVKVS